MPYITNLPEETHENWTLQLDGRWSHALWKIGDAEMYVDETYVYVITPDDGTIAVPRKLIERMTSLHDKAT